MTRKHPLARQDRVGDHEATAREFLRSVLGLEYDDCILSDGSRLEDFAGMLHDTRALAAADVESIGAVWAARVVQVISRRYGLPVEDIAVGMLLVDLFALIEQRQARLH